MQKTIFVSGMHSGQNPCSGLGILRSLREAYTIEQFKLVGVDHWQGSSGLHHAVCDDHWLLPSWNQIQDDLHAQRIQERLESGDYWISALDLEVRWLGENVGTHPRLLAPSREAVEQTAKPEVRAFRHIGYQIPEVISAEAPETEIHAFLREHSWRCWIKSPFHDAARVTNWAAFLSLRAGVSKQWKTRKLFVQRHIAGTEETLTFSADQGELIEAVKLEKRQLTWEGKTWAGRVTQLQGEERERLAECLKEVGWTGGGELEVLRTPDQKTYIIECNPRFPAWIYGATLAGFNLPALLIEKVSGQQASGLIRHARAQQFTRVVMEIPAHPAIGIPLPAEPNSFQWSSEGKVGKGSAPALALPQLRGQTDREEEQSSNNIDSLENRKSPPLWSDAEASEVNRLVRSYQGPTPERLILRENTRSRFFTLAARVREANQSQSVPQVRIGYSIKTCPTRFHVQTAREAGFYAECISQLEIQTALQAGYHSSQVILNGPGKFWPTTEPPRTGLALVFFDSLEEFDRCQSIPHLSERAGFRLRIPGLSSRFGVPIEEPSQFYGLVQRIELLRAQGDFGIHFHMPSWAIGLRRWTQAFGSLLGWGQRLESLTDLPLTRLDLGGGLFPHDLDRIHFQEIQRRVHAALPRVQELIFEPGRALTQNGEVVLSRVLDVRRSAEGVHEALVDACIAELPLAPAGGRPVYIYRVRRERIERFDAGAAAWSKGQALEEGNGRILGRICMEDDILAAHVKLPDDLEVGDAVVFGHAGGYQRSMSYGFGRG